MAGRKLGRGLDSLIEETRTTEEAAPASPVSLPVGSIRPNPFQPRRVFDDGALAELEASIRTHGVLQPVLVRKASTGYELVAGERRWRASQKAGLTEIPAVVRDVADERMLEIALIENVQREDLNPIEKALAYRSFVEELSLTHQAAAERLGKERSTITNQLRLLELEPEVQDLVSRGTLSMGHARALLAVDSPEVRKSLARRIVQEDLSVRTTERLAREVGRTGSEPGPKKGTAGRGPVQEKERPVQLEHLERRLRERFATKARIEGTKEKGRIALDYYSMAELTRLLDLLLPEGDA